jgi:ketosteroid isomerase-like protein
LQVTVRAATRVRPLRDGDYTGGPAAASFVTILTVHDGEIVHWREYRDTLGMAASLGQLPALLASLGGS